MKAASFVILLAAGLAVGLPVSGAAPAAGSRAAVEPRDGYYYAAGRSSHLASVAAGKLAFSFVPAKCAPPGAVRQAAGTLAISGTGTFAFNGGVVGSTGIAAISGRFVDATTLVATITFRTVYGGSECTSKATVTYRWGAPAPVKPKPKSPPATKKPPRVPPGVEELDCKYPQVAALVTPKGAVLPPEYADNKPAGARAVCWPSVRVYTGSLTVTRTASGQTDYRSKSEMEKAISSGTYKLWHAEVSLGGAPEADYRATVNVVGTVTGQSHEPTEGCTWSGSGHVPGISTITIRIGPRAKPLVTHQVETPGSKLEQNFQCTLRGSGTVNDPGLAGVATAWTPVRTWQTLAGSETRQGSIYGFEGLIQLPATTTITWSFKAKRP